MKKVTFKMNMTGMQVLDVIDTINTKTKVEINNRNYQCTEYLHIQTTSVFEFPTDMLAILADYQIASVKLTATTASVFLPDAKIPVNPSIDNVNERHLDLFVRPFVIDNDKQINLRMTHRQRTIWSNINAYKLNVTVRTFDQAWRYLTNHEVSKIYDNRVKNALPTIRKIAADHMRVLNEFNLKTSLAVLADRA